MLAEAWGVSDNGGTSRPFGDGEIHRTSRRERNTSESTVPTPVGSEAAAAADNERIEWRRERRRSVVRRKWNARVRRRLRRRRTITEGGPHRRGRSVDRRVLDGAARRRRRRKRRRIGHTKLSISSSSFKSLFGMTASFCFPFRDTVLQGYEECRERNRLRRCYRRYFGGQRIR